MQFTCGLGRQECWRRFPHHEVACLGIWLEPEYSHAAAPLAQACINTGSVAESSRRGAEVEAAGAGPEADLSLGLTDCTFVVKFLYNKVYQVTSLHLTEYILHIKPTSY